MCNFPVEDASLQGKIIMSTPIPTRPALMDAGIRAGGAHGEIAYWVLSSSCRQSEGQRLEDKIYNFSSGAPYHDTTLWSNTCTHLHLTSAINSWFLVDSFFLDAVSFANTITIPNISQCYIESPWGITYSLPSFLVLEPQHCTWEHFFSVRLRMQYLITRNLKNLGYTPFMPLVYTWNHFYQVTLATISWKFSRFQLPTDFTTTPHNLNKFFNHSVDYIELTNWA